jgi:hypothetical protein
MKLEVLLMSNEITHIGWKNMVHERWSHLLHEGSHIIPQPESKLGKVAVANLPYVVLYAIAVVLVAMTDHNPASAYGTWNYFIPLVGIVSTISGWHEHAGNIWRTQVRYLLRQVVHWGALLVVIHLLFQTDVQHFLRAETDGFIIVYLLGLASILSGLYLDWKMGVFGLFLIFSGVFIAYLDNNALLIAIGGIAMMAVSGTIFAWIKFHQHHESHQLDEPHRF